jgi:hypothetical protein
MNWLRQIFSRRRRYDDISVTIHEHLNEKIDELMEDGMSREQAETKPGVNLEMLPRSRNAVVKHGNGPRLSPFCMT